MPSSASWKPEAYLPKRRWLNRVVLHSPKALPDFPLASSEEITNSFLNLNIHSFREAADYVHHLHYGRNTDRADYSLVLHESLGTCSTKHALLARLAEEQSRKDVLLTLGIYEMDSGNTPGIGHVLSRHGLSSIPEAHCYLTYNGIKVDLTHPGGSAAEPIDRFLHEETISPKGIGAYKTSLHERFLKDIQDASAHGGLDWRELLSVREECIAALSS